MSVKPRTKTFHFPGKKKKKKHNNNNTTTTNNNKKHAWCWTKKLLLPFPYMFINKTSYMELRSVWWVSSWLAVCSPINCMFSNWLESSACLLHHFLLCSGPKCNLSTWLKHNPRLFIIATAKIALEFEACKKREGVVHSLVVVVVIHTKPISTQFMLTGPLPSQCVSPTTLDHAWPAGVGENKMKTLQCVILGKFYFSSVNLN